MKERGAQSMSEQLSRAQRNNKNTKTKNKKNNGTKKQKSSIWWKIWCTVFVLIFVGTIAVGTFATILLIDVQKDYPTINTEDIVTRQASQVYGKNGGFVSTLAEDANINVTIDEVPQSVIDALTATEDARYYRHKGVDGPRTMKAFVDLIVAGGIVSGGSTITQQLVQNTILSDKMAEDEEYRNSKRRKIDEWVLSYRLEKELTKDEIMVSYLNNAINFGRFTGIGTVSKRYFNKNVSELTLPEAALLAGIPQLPGENNPFESIDGATQRYNTVLKLMVKHKYITQEEADEALKIPLADLIERDHMRQLNPNAAYYTAIESELIHDIFKIDPESDMVSSIYQNYVIHTNLVQEQQILADQIMNTNEYVDWENAGRILYGYGDDVTEDDLLNFQGAFTVVENATGAIPAIGAARQISQHGINIAVDGYRSPGSSIKPIIDYAPYVEKFQVAATSVMNDKPTFYSGGGGQVYNYNHGAHEGFISIEKAIGVSKNTTAVQALQAVGLEYAAEKAGQMGITKAMPLLEEGLLGESAALGGGLETTTKEMAGAYATIANGGIHNTPHTINRVENMKGEVIWEYNKDGIDSERVLTEATAATMMEALIWGVTSNQGTTNGGGRRQLYGDIQIGGKTGTSSYAPEEGVSSDREKDHWQVSSTPDYSVAAWTGLSVEGSEVLGRTGGNVNGNKHLGSHMIMAWLSEFAEPGGRFSFLGAANQGNAGSIGDFNLSVSDTTATWTVPGLNLPSGLTEEDKKSIGGVVFDVTVTLSNGKSVSLSGTKDTSVNFGDKLCPTTDDCIIYVVVTARAESEYAQAILSPVGKEATREIKGTGKKDDDSTNNNEETSSGNNETGTGQ